MVRHECAEALGSVGGKEVEEELARCDDILNSMLKFPSFHHVSDLGWVDLD